MGHRHYGCSVPGCKVVRAYVRYRRTNWKPVGYFTTGCKTFQPDRESEKS